MTWPRNTELCAELGDKIRAGIQKPGSHNYLEVVRQGCLGFFPDPLSVGDRSLPSVARAAPVCVHAC